jgi:hypothetical protein
MSTSVYTAIKHLNTLLALHFKRCLTTEYSETAAHFNANYYTHTQINVPNTRSTATYRTHCISCEGEIWAVGFSCWKYSYSLMISFSCLWNVKPDDGCLVQPQHVAL